MLKALLQATLGFS